MNFDNLTKYLDNLINHGTPACEMLIVKKHKQIYHHCSGYSDYSKTVPANENDMYNIFSNTKVITAVAAMQLVESGKICLSDPISKYIPEYKNMFYKDREDIVPCKNKITVYNLLTMTSGFNYERSGAVADYVKKHPKASTLDILKEYAKTPLSFEPGSCWKYSTGLDVLGGVIEVASGMTLGQYFKKYIFKPLNITDISFDFDVFGSRLSAFYENKSGITVPQSKNRGVLSSFSNKFESGGDGLISTAKSYTAVLDALANGGIGKSGVRILSPSSIEQIKQPRLNNAMSEQYYYSHQKTGYNYGFAVRTLTDKSFGARTPIGEFGWDGYTGGYGLVDTVNNIAICYMQNVANHLYAWRNIFPETRNMIYKELGIN